MKFGIEFIPSWIWCWLASTQRRWTATYQEGQKQPCLQHSDRSWWSSVEQWPSRPTESLRRGNHMKQSCRPNNKISVLAAEANITCITWLIHLLYPDHSSSSHSCSFHRTLSLPLLRILLLQNSWSTWMMCDNKWYATISYDNAQPKLRSGEADKQYLRIP